MIQLMRRSVARRNETRRGMAPQWKKGMKVEETTAESLLSTNEVRLHKATSAEPQPNSANDPRVTLSLLRWYDDSRSRVRPARGLGAPSGEGRPTARRPEHRTPRRKRQLGDTRTRRALERTSARTVALGARLRGGTCGQWQRRTRKLKERASDLGVHEWKQRPGPSPELDLKDENERKDNRRKDPRSVVRSHGKTLNTLRLNEG